MATNQTEKTTVVLNGPSNTTIVHSNPAQAPAGSLASGGKQIGPSVVHKNPA